MGCCDGEVVREIWESCIPVAFSLAADQVSSLNLPPPFYLMVPRILYFPQLTHKVRRHFLQYLNPQLANNEMWLEWNGEPVPWNYPVGLWFDLQAEGHLPWPLTLHFQNFPHHKLIPCPSQDAIRSHFMATLKEADALKHKGQVINSMQEKDHSHLWQGLQNDKFDQFWSVNKKLMESVVGEGFRNIPIRCYTGDKMAIQRLVSPIDERSGGWRSLQDALLQFTPHFQPHTSRVLVHGIQPPLSTPIQWLSEHLSYPDNFLHLVILPAPAPQVPLQSNQQLPPPTTTHYQNNPQ